MPPTIFRTMSQHSGVAAMGEYMTIDVSLLKTLILWACTRRSMRHISKTWTSGIQYNKKFKKAYRTYSGAPYLVFILVVVMKGCSNVHSLCRASLKTRDVGRTEGGNGRKSFCLWIVEVSSISLDILGVPALSAAH